MMMGMSELKERPRRLVRCEALDCMPCDQWFWVGEQERPHLLRFPEFCKVHGPMEEEV